MNTPDVQLGASVEVETGSAIDLTDQVVDMKVAALHVNDRVQRLTGDSEEASWGTVTARIDDGEATAWLVVDNLGRTHRDNEADLCRAMRGQAKRRMNSR
jgi:hypothetical protein